MVNGRESQVPEQKPPNEVTGLLSTLARSSDRWVQLATLGLIAFSGFGNWAATNNASQQTFAGQLEIRREAREQLNDLHRWIQGNMDEFHKGNEDVAANRRTLQKVIEEIHQAEKNQTLLLENQAKILENDAIVLAEVRKGVEKLSDQKRH